MTTHESLTSSTLDLTLCGKLTYDAVGTTLCRLTTDDIESNELLIILVDADGGYITNEVIKDVFTIKQIVRYIIVRHMDAEMMILCKPCSEGIATDRFYELKRDMWKDARAKAAVGVYGMWTFDPRGNGRAQNLSTCKWTFGGLGIDSRDEEQAKREAIARKKQAHPGSETEVN